MGIEGAVGDAGVGAGEAGLVAQRVLRVGGGEGARIDDLRGLVERVERGARPSGAAGVAVAKAMNLLTSG